MAPHLTDPAAIQAAKQALRQRMLLLRSQAGDDAALVAAILSHTEWHAGETIAGIWPLDGEPDLRPLWHTLHARGHPVLLPETPPRGEALRFRPWHPDCAMVPGRFATLHPDTGVQACATPGLVFVPLLAFDRRGYRLGYGGGYYDRTLAALPQARAIGYGFSRQQVEAVPHGPFDIPLQVIVTENGCIPIER